MSRNVLLYLADIQESCEKVLKYTAGMTYRGFHLTRWPFLSKFGNFRRIYTMKPHRLFWFLSLLICLSLSCSIVSDPPPVEAQPPVDQPPVEPQTTESQPYVETQQPVKSPLSALKNPGFEDGFNYWSELPAALLYDGQSVDEDVVSHSGNHSRKLFLRYGGSYILQRIPVNPPLPLHSKVTLFVFVKMPYAGTQSNKCFTLELVIGNANLQQKATYRDQYDALSDWTELWVAVENSDFPITWIEIHAMTNKGEGLNRDFDKPVYVDDFMTEVFSGPP